MATRKKSKTTKKASAQKKKKDLRNEICGVILIGLGILLLLSLVIHADSAFKTYIADGFMRGAFGVGAYVIPLLLIFFGVQAIRVKHPELHAGKLVMTLLMVLSGVGLIHMGFSWFAGISLMNILRSNYMRPYHTRAPARTPLFYPACNVVFAFT